MILHSREKQGAIKILKWQDRTILVNQIINGEKIRICMVPDFRIKNLITGEELHVEAKGRLHDQEWRQKRKNWLLYAKTRMEVWGGSWKKPYLVEILKPRSLESQ